MKKKAKPKPSGEVVKTNLSFEELIKKALNTPLQAKGKDKKKKKDK